MQALSKVKGTSIYNLCQNSTGTPTGTVSWWEQDLSHWLDLEKDCDPQAHVIRGKGALHKGTEAGSMADTIFHSLIDP